MHDIINYSTSICPFESGKSGKEEEKIQKFRIQRAFYMKWKTFFTVFEGLSYGEKIKNK